MRGQKRSRVLSALDSHGHVKSGTRQFKRSKNLRTVIETKGPARQESAEPEPESLQEWSPNDELEGWEIEDHQELVDEAAGLMPSILRKRYTSSDNPMRDWMAAREEFLREIMRLEAQDASGRAGVCPSCVRPSVGDEEESTEPLEGTEPLFRCRECTWGINECAYLAAVPSKMVPSYRKVPCKLKVSAHEYYGNLERLTNNLRINTPKTRYPAFLRIVRQYRHLRMLKRAGRAHAKDGVATTAKGELAVRCPACPRKGVNLPEDWSKVDPALKFLYMLFVSIDANFRLKNRLRKNEKTDPGLHTGLAYFVPQQPYNEHILRHVTEADISSCSGFSAMSRADSKSTSGLRYTGVGMCVCSRHEMVRALGVGDLQKGERYCNMDYIFLSALLSVALTSVMIIYDIACQWKVNLPARMSQFPAELQIPSACSLQFAIPKCHTPAHQTPCQAPHSLNLKPGAGRTDGEGIERDWSVLNPAASSTREMGRGLRHDTLDDLFSYHNWQKTTALGQSLKRKYYLAAVESCRHQKLHEDFCKSVPANVQRAWTKMISDWEANPKKPNPYEVPTSYETESDVKKKLLAIECRDSALGTISHDKTESTFISAGLMIEESQRRVSMEPTSGLTSLQASQLHERRLIIMKQIRVLRKAQSSHIPMLDILLKDAADVDPESIKLWLPLLDPIQRGAIGASVGRDDGRANRIGRVQRLGSSAGLLLTLRARVYQAGCKAEDTRRRRRATSRGGPSRLGCTASLVAKETEFRIAQCNDALERIRLNQRAKRQVVIHKKVHVPGQRSGAQAHSDFERLDMKIRQAAAKYRAARVVLIALVGEANVPEGLRVLRDEDICPPPVFDIDVIAPIRNIRQAAATLGEGYREVPWIWRVAGQQLGEDMGELNAGLRVEWAKSRARYLRWKEEVLLVKEEMRRVRVTFEYEGNVWRQRQSEASKITTDPVLAQGLAAYAHRQTCVREQLRSSFTAIWERPPGKRSKLALSIGAVTVGVPTADDHGLRSEMLAAVAEEDEDEEDEDEDEGTWSDDEELRETADDDDDDDDDDGFDDDGFDDDPDCD
ncbi:hypothetical protein ONZ45_g11741 [Pleurotus djamor]|nr:hypothetical protein ONZ45_g11741 [Pleurotus djamor]